MMWRWRTGVLATVMFVETSSVRRSRWWSTGARSTAWCGAGGARCRCRRRTWRATSPPPAPPSRACWGRTAASTGSSRRRRWRGRRGTGSAGLTGATSNIPLNPSLHHYFLSPSFISLLLPPLPLLPAPQVLHLPAAVRPDLPEGLAGHPPGLPLPWLPPWTCPCASSGGEGREGGCCCRERKEG